MSRNHSNILKKCLTLILVFSSLTVLLIIFYLENSVREVNVDDDVQFFNEVKIREEKKLLNLTDFKYIIKNNVCETNPKKVLVVLIVTSYAGDPEVRSAIRRSFPSKILSKFGVRRVFLLALIDESNNYNQVSQAAIEDENRRFGDIIQGNFYEAYRNLTYKHMMGLQWASNYCPQAKYIIKMDHDIIFDFYRLNFLLKKLPHNKFLLAGYVMSHMKPIREPKNKWFVTQKEYSKSSYPDFLSGWFYITNPKTAEYLCKVSDKVKYFWIDDLYVTGLLAERANMSLVRLNKFYTTHPEYLQCCIDKPNFICDYLIGPTGNDQKLMFKYQKYAEGCFYKNCKKRKEENSLKSTCIATWKEEPFGKGRAVIDLVKLSFISMDSDSYSEYLRARDVFETRQLWGERPSIQLLLLILPSLTILMACWSASHSASNSIFPATLQMSTTCLLFEKHLSPVYFCFNVLTAF